MVGWWTMLIIPAGKTEAGGSQDLLAGQHRLLSEFEALSKRQKQKHTCIQVCGPELFKEIDFHGQDLLTHAGIQQPQLECGAGPI